MNLQQRLVKYTDLVPCKNAFIDTRSPGSDKKENFTIIGPGVSENPEQHIHISIPHGFNIGGARQPNGCLNSQHSHLTEEVFIAHTGKWAFRSGVDGSDAEVIMDEGDIISLPTDIFRGFENVGQGSGYLFAVLGQDDPGRVTWAPQVFDLAEQYGLVLLENGALVDTAAGQQIPEGIARMPKTTQAQINAHKIVSNKQIANLVVKKIDFAWQQNTLLSQFKGVEEAPLVGAENAAEHILGSKLNWAHGFVVRAIKMAPGAMIPMHTRAEEEVIFVQQGELTMNVEKDVFDMQKGDTFSTPIGAMRSFFNNTESELLFYVVRRNNMPQAPKFV